MNPHASPPVSLASFFRSLWTNRELLLRMTKRDIVGRYKGSAIGLLWSFVNPIALLTVYTFVFSVVFEARWGTRAEPRSQFAVVLFTGMIVHSLFAETLTRATSLIVSNVSYVKKVVFPLDILPAMAMGTACFHAAVSTFVLMAAVLIMNGKLAWTVVFLPVVATPLLLLCLGLALFLASLGVYVRDVVQPIGLIMTIALFASPVFYPLSALPPSIQPWLILNPLTFIIEQMRAVLIYGAVPAFTGLIIYLLVALVVLWLGYAWFQKTRRGFANVL